MPQEIPGSFLTPRALWPRVVQLDFPGFLPRLTSVPFSPPWLK